MSAEDREAQEDELLALASIYTEDEFRRAADGQVGQLRACLELPQNFRIFVGDHDAKNALKGDFEVFFLPPVVLTFELPEDYPSTSAPDYALTCKWLTPLQLTSLCKQLDYLWEENKGGVVLFTWLQFLKEEALQHLNIVSPFEVTVHGEGMCRQKNVVRKDGERDTRESIAQPGLLDERALQDADSLDSLIRDILNFDEAQQVKQLVAEELFSRYDRLLLQSSLDSMADVVYCPRLNCQTPVVKEPGGTMGICSNCRFVFCDLCKRIYHGVASCTQPEEKEEEVDTNPSPAADSEALASYSYKEGKYRQWQEKVYKQYVATNCKMCPVCNVPIEKNGGCHRMYCTKCLTMFCWECNLPFFRKLDFSSMQKPLPICTC